MAISAATASIIAAGIGAAGAGATTTFNAAQTKKQRQWSEKMWNAQNAWNLEQWNAQNEYNTPEAQLQRLRDAGLNPLYYGLDGSSAGDLSSAQPLGYERANMGSADNPILAGLDAATRTAQISNIQADTAKKSEETLSEVVRREQMQQNIKNAVQELENMKTQKDLNDAQRREIDKRITWMDRLNEAAVSEKESSAALSQAQKNRIEALLEGEKLIQARTYEDFQHKWNKISAEIGKMAKETKLSELDIENYALNHAQNGFMGTGVSLPNILRTFGTPKENPGKKELSDDMTDSMYQGLGVK